MPLSQLPITRLNASLIITFTLMCFAAGCGRSGPPTGRVEGKITYDSKPVTNASVIFSNAERGWLRVATLGADGNYQMDEVNVGDYKVSVQPPEPKMPDEIPGPQAKMTISPGMTSDPANIPRAFHSSLSTPLKAAVASGSNSLNFDLAKP
jgi:hypothetical protein